VNHTAFSRKGGRARSQAKTAANRAKALAYWNAVRAGLQNAPYRPRVPPPLGALRNLLSDYCRQSGIVRLEAFGSTARGDASRGSDVDLIATFSENPGLRFFAMEEEMGALLGAPVHLLTRDSVDEMSNPYRRESIAADAKEIFHA
jgi:predicted nucleotidyltransferase